MTRVSKWIVAAVALSLRCVHSQTIYTDRATCTGSQGIPGTTPLVEKYFDSLAKSSGVPAETFFSESDISGLLNATIASGNGTANVRTCTFENSGNPFLTAIEICQSNTASCVSAAFYEGKRCSSASICNPSFQPAAMSFSFQCAGIDTNFPLCAGTCVGYSALGLSTCVTFASSAPSVAPARNPNTKTSAAGRIRGGALVLHAAMSVTWFLLIPFAAPS